MSTEEKTDATEIGSKIERYEILSMRRVVTALTEEQEMMLMQQTDAGSVTEALEATYLQEERESVEPEERLVGVSVEAEETGE